MRVRERLRWIASLDEPYASYARWGIPEDRWESYAAWTARAVDEING